MSTVDDLKAKLKKLKNKEAALEADLAIRDYPELEEGIYDVIVAIATLHRLDNDIRLVETKFDAKLLEKTKQQLEMYKRKRAGLRLKTGDAAKKMADFYDRKIEVMDMSAVKRKIPGHEGLKLKRKNSLGELEKACRLWLPKFTERHFDFRTLLPSIGDYLDVNKFV